MRRVALTTALVLATLLVVVLLWQFRDVIGLFLLSLAVSATLRPIINQLILRRVPSGFAILIVYVVGIVTVASLIIAISQPLISDMQHLANDFLRVYEEIKIAWPRGNMIQQVVAGQLPTTNDLLAQVSGQQTLALAATLVGVTFSTADSLGQIILILVLSLYWSSDQVRFERLWLSLLTVDDRAQARSIWRAVESGLGAYIRSEVAQSLLALLILSVAFSQLGLHYPMLVALICAVLWFIPLVGGLLVLVPVLAAGLLSGPLVALASIGFTVALLAVLELLIEPRLFDRRRYNPIGVLLVIIAMTNAFGMLGLIVAPAVAVAIEICVTALAIPVALVPTGAVQSESQTMPQVDQIRSRLANVRTLVSRMDEPPPRVLSMMGRLEGLVKKLEPIAQQAPETEGVNGGSTMASGSDPVIASDVQL